MSAAALLCLQDCKSISTGWKTWQHVESQNRDLELHLAMISQVWLPTVNLCWVLPIVNMLNIPRDRACSGSSGSSASCVGTVTLCTQTSAITISDVC